MLRAVPIFLLSLSVRIRSTRGIMVSLSINTNTGDSGFTFEGWIHPFSSSAPTHDYLFKTHTTDYRDVRVIVENCSSVEFSFWDNNNGNPGRGTEHQFFPGGLSCGTWSHVAATYDGATMRWYVNGTLIGSQAAAGGMLINDPVQIGGWSGNSGEQFTGDMDEVRVWNRALSAAEINAFRVRELTGADSGLVHYLRFNSEDAFTVNGNDHVRTWAPQAMSTDEDVAVSMTLSGSDALQTT
ncbi:MAG: hypothetical protein CME15_00135 [Gemmatimonadetes bacterium]|nr:hypothetical protein [Gemmatimonadota bacterium]